MRYCQICGAPNGTCNETMRGIAERQPTITRRPALREVKEMRTLIAKETYWFNADKTEVVRDGDANARFLLVRKGSPVDPGVAETYGLETEPAPTEIYPAPGANVPAGVSSARHIEVTRRVSAEVASNREAATDASTSRQVAGAIEGQVAKELGAPASQAAATSKAHAELSLSGSDLLTGAEAARGTGGGELGGAYKDRTGDNPEAGAQPPPPQGAQTPAPNERTAEVSAPAGAGASPKTAESGAGASPEAAEAAAQAPNLQAGTQEYTGSAGVAITPPGTERVDKTKPPPPPAGGGLQAFAPGGSALGTGAGVAGGTVPTQVGGGAPNVTVAGSPPAHAPTLAEARGEAEKAQDDTLAGAAGKAKEENKPAKG